MYLVALNRNPLADPAINADTKRPHHSLWDRGHLRHGPFLSYLSLSPTQSLIYGIYVS
jgi:hypothetical protein